MWPTVSTPRTTPTENPSGSRRFLLGLLRLLMAIVILRVSARIVANYIHYAPPDFQSDFLRGREAYFWGPYHWAFYAHIISGPIALTVGLFLVAERSRGRFPALHRVLGRVHVANVVFLVAPSGLAMAPYAASGPVGALGLSTLAVATAACAVLGTLAAVHRRFRDHRRWMMRLYLLLCSAVVLRLIGGFAVVAGLTAAWIDPLANWLSWLGPLAIFELRERSKTTAFDFTKTPGGSPPHRPPSATTVSQPPSYSP